MKVSVFVKPNSKKGDLVEVSSGGLTVFLQAKAVDGAANQALIKALAKHFDVAKSRVMIVAGHKSRHKIAEIDSVGDRPNGRKEANTKYYFQGDTVKPM